MSSLRIFWIIWCAMWALFWFVVGLYTLGLAWLMILPTLLAILIPIGRENRPTTTVYVLPGYAPYAQQWQPYPGWTPPPPYGAPWQQLPPAAVDGRTASLNPPQPLPPPPYGDR